MPGAPQKPLLGQYRAPHNRYKCRHKRHFDLCPERNRGARRPQKACECLAGSLVLVSTQIYIVAFDPCLAGSGDGCERQRASERELGSPDMCAKLLLRRVKCRRDVPARVGGGRERCFNQAAIYFWLQTPCSTSNIRFQQQFPPLSLWLYRCLLLFFFCTCPRQCDLCSTASPTNLRRLKGSSIKYQLLCIGSSIEITKNHYVVLSYFSHFVYNSSSD
jgi:hypothetical protein